jgi:hypothetical protein
VVAGGRSAVLRCDHGHTLCVRVLSLQLLGGATAPGAFSFSKLTSDVSSWWATLDPVQSHASVEADTLIRADHAVCWVSLLVPPQFIASLRFFCFWVRPNIFLLLPVGAMTERTIATFSPRGRACSDAPLLSYSCRAAKRLRTFLT